MCPEKFQDTFDVIRLQIQLLLNTKAGHMVSWRIAGLFFPISNEYNFIEGDDKRFGRCVRFNSIKGIL